MHYLLLALLFTVCTLVQAAPAERSVSVRAEGYVEAVPDMLEFSITVKSTKANLSNARADVDSVVATAVKQARSLGIAGDDIDSSSLHTYPEYEWRQQQRYYLGESVVRTVVFKLRDLDNYPKLAQQLSQLSLHQIGRPQLSHSNIDQLRLEALKAAIARGKIKAAVIAAEIAAQLGPVLNVQEATSNRPQPRVMMAEAAMNTAENDGYNYAKRRISATVEMRFALH